MDDREFGKLESYMKSNASLLAETRGDMKQVLANQAATEVRLASGAQRFQDHEARIRKNEARKCPPFAKPRTIYACIGLGVTVLGIIIKVSI